MTSNKILLKKIRSNIETLERTVTINQKSNYANIISTKNNAVLLLEKLHLYLNYLENEINYHANSEQITYLTEQITSISNNLFTSSKISNKLSPRQGNPIDNSSPRQKLKQYYQYIRTFDEMIHQRYQELSQTTDKYTQNNIQTIIDKTKLRRKNCMQAIEALEEQLANLTSEL